MHRDSRLRHAHKVVGGGAAGTGRTSCIDSAASALISKSSLDTFFCVFYMCVSSFSSWHICIVSLFFSFIFASVTCLKHHFSHDMLLRHTFLEVGLHFRSIMFPDLLESHGALPVSQLLTWRALLSGHREKKQTNHESRIRRSTFTSLTYNKLWCSPHVSWACQQLVLLCPADVLTEGERDSGGVSWRASSGWIPDQSREGDVFGGSTMVMTPPPSPNSSCSTLTPTPAMLTFPPERRCSAGGLGSTILL